jgi:sulfofructose kinase
MTFGADGVLALDSAGLFAVPAFVVDAVDTTGAGDVFHAGYAFARVSGRGFAASLRYGAAAAALKCRSWGGRGGLPSPAAVEELLAGGETRVPAGAVAGHPERR